MKNDCPATVVIGKVSPLHLIWNTGTKFFCNKLHKDIITQKMSLKVQIFDCADVPQWWEFPLDEDSYQFGTFSVLTLQVYLHIFTLYY